MTVPLTPGMASSSRATPDAVRTQPPVIAVRETSLFHDKVVPEVARDMGTVSALGVAFALAGLIASESGSSEKAAGGALMLAIMVASFVAALWGHLKLQNE